MTKRSKLRNAIISAGISVCFTKIRFAALQLWKYLMVIVIVSSFFYRFPLMYATRYPYIKQEDMWDDLVKTTITNVTFAESDCKYDVILNDTTSMMEYIRKEIEWDGANIKIGGEYIPPNCRSLFSIAIIVPYRQREIHLRKFLLYMHTFLKKQLIHYRIFVVEQDNLKPFNRAKLLNIGAHFAINAGYPCLILHDVDLLPYKINNIYACTKLPRHMSSSIAVFRFNLPYKTLFGGAVAILSSQFVEVNGLSNFYDGWGGEDDDFYRRIISVNLDICRFNPEISMYDMMSHLSEAPNPSRNSLLSDAKLRIRTDGLNNLKFNKKTFKLHPLFSHIVVDF